MSIGFTPRTLVGAPVSTQFATIGTIYGLNGQSIVGDANGAWAFTANGTNQNITLTPSGTGSVVVASGASLLLGTATNSNNGRLQLATHTTNTGGIGFGTDTVLYRIAANSLRTDGAFRIGANQLLGFASHGGFTSQSDGVLTLYNNSGSDFNRLQFGGTSSSFPALKRSSTELQVKLADDSAYAPIAIGNTVQVAAAVASTHKVTINIGGTTYYLLASNV